MIGYRKKRAPRETSNFETSVCVARLRSERARPTSVCLTPQVSNSMSFSCNNYPAEQRQLPSLESVSLFIKLFRYNRSEETKQFALFCQVQVGLVYFVPASPDQIFALLILATISMFTLSLSLSPPILTSINFPRKVL
eukprot:sb/3474417/